MLFTFTQGGGGGKLGGGVVGGGVVGGGVTGGVEGGGMVGGGVVGGVEGGVEGGKLGVSSLPGASEMVSSSSAWSSPSSGDSKLGRGSIIY